MDAEQVLPPLEALKEINQGGKIADISAIQEVDKPLSAIKGCRFGLPLVAWLILTRTRS